MPVVNQKDQMPNIFLNTKNILFISGGAFDGIEDHISRRVNKRIIGFKTEIETQKNKENILINISPQDLKTYGLIKGSLISLKRILSCHPVKFLGGGDGFDPVKKNIKVKK